MSQTTGAVHGNGFVIYDEWDGNTGTVSTNVKDFLASFEKYARNSDQYKHVKFDDPYFEINDILDEKSLSCVVERYDYSGPYDDSISSYFRSINGKEASPLDMLVVWCDKEPSMYAAPYKSKYEYMDAMKAKLDEIGFMAILGDDFDYESHIGEFDTCVTG